MNNELVREEFKRLSNDEEAELEHYTGMRSVLTNEVGEILEVSDTRTDRGNYLTVKRGLKSKIAEAYIESYPQYKYEKARLGNVSDKKEQARILKREADLQSEYGLRKALMNKYLDNHELVHSLGCSGEYEIRQDPKILHSIYTGRVIKE